MKRVWLRRALMAPTALRLWSAYYVLAALKRCVPLPTLARWAWVESRRQRDPRAEQRVAGVIQAVRRFVGVRDDCLQTSLLLYRELSRLGADPLLAVGFRRRGDGLEGHAWVSLAGVPLESDDDADGFIAVCSFGRHGAVVAQESA